MKAIVLINIVNGMQSIGERTCDFKVREMSYNGHHWIKFYFVKTQALPMLLWVVWPTGNPFLSLEKSIIHNKYSCSFLTNDLEPHKKNSSSQKIQRTVKKTHSGVRLPGRSPWSIMLVPSISKYTLESAAHVVNFAGVPPTYLRLAERRSSARG